MAAPIQRGHRSGRAAASWPALVIEKSCTFRAVFQQADGGAPGPREKAAEVVQGHQTGKTFFPLGKHSEQSKDISRRIHTQLHSDCGVTGHKAISAQIPALYSTGWARMLASDPAWAWIEPCPLRPDSYLCPLTAAWTALPTTPSTPGQCTSGPLA